MRVARVPSVGQVDQDPAHRPGLLREVCLRDDLQ